jgi:nucleoid DNA-binding protein
MALSKNEIASEIEARGAGGARQVKHMLDTLADVAAEEIAAGEDFTIPGVVAIKWAFAKPRTKGEMYKAGDTVKGPQGERVAEEDSKARKASVKLRAAPTGKVGKLRPKRDPAAQRQFLSTKAGKNIVSRKG